MFGLALAAVAGTSALAAWLVDRRRSRRRNEHGECATCGISWAETQSTDPYLIHGQLVCEDCGLRYRVENGIPVMLLDEAIRPDAG